MNYKRNLSLLTMGAASLLVAGVAMAAPPTGFSYGQYKVATGAITTTDSACGTSYVCVPLAASGDGITQRQVTETATGKSYIQTIIVDNVTGTADTGGLDAIVGSTYHLDFTNESFVGVNTPTSGDLGVDSAVALVATGSQGPAIANTGGNNLMTASIAQGGLATPGDPTHVKIIQHQKLDPTGTTGVEGQGQTDFALFSNAADESDRFMRLDQRVTADQAQGLTVRRASGSYIPTAGGTFTLPAVNPVAVPANPDQTLAYTTANTNIGVTWLQAVNMGGAGLPSTDPHIFQMQKYDVDGSSIAWNSCNTDGFGSCVSLNGTSTSWPVANWDATAFGTAPNPIASGSPPSIWFPAFPTTSAP